LDKKTERRNKMINHYKMSTIYFLPYCKTEIVLKFIS